MSTIKPWQERLEPLTTRTRAVNKAEIAMQQEIDELRAALPVWRDILTAPKDGAFLVGHIRAGRLHWAHSVKRGHPPLSHLFFNLLGDAVRSPTHWSPLPQPQGAT